MIGKRQSGRGEKRNNIADILTAVLFLALVFGFSAAFVIKQAAFPQNDFSEQENRYLAEFPKLSSYGKTLDKLIDGSFTEGIGDFYSDRFPLRDSFTGLAAAGEILLLKGESNGVMLADDGLLIQRRDGFDRETVSENIKALSAMAEGAAKRDIPLAVYFAERGVGENTNYRCFVEAECEKYSLNAGIADIPSESEEILYYKTDHHWNTAGAYRGYLDICALLGIEPYPESDFEKETVSREFYGTLWSKACMKWVGADSIELWRYGGDEEFKVSIADTSDSFYGFYDTSYLAKKDKYSLFLSGNNARTDIVLEGSERERIVIVKDSFAHSAAPFLARHFDITLIDPRYYTGSAAVLAEELDASFILILCDIYSVCDYKELFLLASVE